MNAKLARQIVPNAALLLLAVGAWIQAGRLEGDGSAIGPDLWPKMICVLLGVVSAIGIVVALLEARPGSPAPAAASEPDEGLPPVPETQPLMVWVAVLATGLFVYALEQVGFVCAAAAYAMALLVIGGMRRWWAVAPAGIALSLVFTLIFMRVVYVALPIGEGVFKAVSLAVFGLLGIH
jgi:putative tricarboxylic transport membrane protein